MAGRSPLQGPRRRHDFSTDVRYVITILRTFRTRAARYPVGGIKQTVDGIIRVEPTDFIPSCYVPPGVDGGSPDGG